MLELQTRSFPALPEDTPNLSLAAEITGSTSKLWLYKPQNRQTGHHCHLAPKFPSSWLAGQNGIRHYEEWLPWRSEGVSTACVCPSTGFCQPSLPSEIMWISVWVQNILPPLPLEFIFLQLHGEPCLLHVSHVIRQGAGSLLFIIIIYVQQKFGNILAFGFTESFNLAYSDYVHKLSCPLGLKRPVLLFHCHLFWEPRILQWCLASNCCQLLIFQCSLDANCCQAFSSPFCAIRVHHEEVN